MGKIFALLLLVSLLIPFYSMAQTGPVQGHSFIGGTHSITSGLNSANYVDGIVPGATITVYLTGTLTKATGLTSDGTTALSNPFTSNVATSVNPGGWIFYASISAAYDVVGSGGGSNPSCTTAPNCYAVPTTLCVDCFPSQTIGGIFCPSGCTLTGPLNGTSASFSGTVNSAGGTLTGPLNGTSASFSGIVATGATVQGSNLGISPLAPPYNADPMGSTDSSAALSAAFAAGGLVDLCKGNANVNYKIMSPITISTSVIIRGSSVNYANAGNCKITVSGAINGLIFAHPVQLQNVEIVGTAGALNGIVLDNAENALISDNSIHGFMEGGISFNMAAGHNNDQVTIRRNYIWGNGLAADGSGGIDVPNTGQSDNNGAHLSDNNISLNTGPGIRLRGFEWDSRGDSIHDNGACAVQLGANADPVNSVMNNYFFHPEFEANATTNGGLCSTTNSYGNMIIGHPVQQLNGLTGADGQSYMVSPTGVLLEDMPGFVIQRQSGNKITNVTVQAGANQGTSALQCWLNLAGNSTCIGPGGNVVLGGQFIAPVNGSTPGVYMSGSTGAAYPFQNYGNMIIEGGYPGIGTDIVFMENGVVLGAALSGGQFSWRGDYRNATSQLIPSTATGNFGSATGKLLLVSGSPVAGTYPDGGAGAWTALPVTKSGTPTVNAGVCWKTATQLGTCTAGTWPNCTTCN
jgi:hypothetical protein